MYMTDPRMYHGEPGGPIAVGKKVWLCWNPHSMEMRLTWKGKEQLLTLRFLTFSSLHPHQGPRSTCTHTKKRLSSFPGTKIALEDRFTSRTYRSYMEARARAEVHKGTEKVNSHYQINGQRKTTEKG